MIRPVAHRNHIVRPRLQRRLDQGVGRRLILVSAAAGYGKTSLVASWLPTRIEPTIWLSLDKADNDPNRFLTYLTSAIQSALPGLVDTLAAALKGVPPPQPEQAFASLLHLLSQIETPVVIVLDDYHLIENRVIHEGLQSLLKQAPQRMTLLILSRADPPFALGRLRANQALVEIRADALRFNEQELTHFLEQHSAHQLNASSRSQLQERTEGWPAGVQLAALALRQAAAPDQFITQFAGTNRFILDYLLEEVLNEQTPERLQFLYHIALLPRFNAALADAVRQKQDSVSHLEAIEQQNLFLVPLDDSRTWFRFHHLFADLLKAQVTRSIPALIRPVHQRAAAWFESHNQPEAALDHALLADDLDSAARLIAGPALSASYRSEVETLLRWYRAFPEGFAHDKPGLALHFGVNFALNGRFAEAQALYEQLRDDQRLPAGEKLIWSYLMPTTAADFPRLQGLISEATESAVTKPITAVGIGLAYGLLNEHQKGCDWFERAIDMAAQQQQMETWATAKTHLARFHLQMGKFAAAAQLSREILAAAAAHPLANALRSILGRIAFEQMALAEAEQFFLDARTMAWQSGLLAGTIPITNMFLAEIAAVRGETEQALAGMAASLAASERYDFPGELAWMKLHEARLHLMLDIPVSAPPVWTGIPQSRYHSPHFGRIQAAWYWLKRDRPAEALPLLTHVTSLPPNESTLDALCLLALTRAAESDRQNAATTLTQALALAAESNRKLPFYRLGQPMRALLSQLAANESLCPRTASRFSGICQHDPSHQLDQSGKRDPAPYRRWFAPIRRLPPS